MAGTNAPDSLDVIRVKNLQVMASFSDGAQWLSDTAKLQPVQITLDIAYDVSGAAAADDLTQSINYSDVCKTLTSTATSQTFASLEDLCSSLLAAVFADHAVVQDITVHITRTRALLHPATTGIRTSRTRGQNTNLSADLMLHNLEYRTIVGVNACERADTQLVRFDLTLHVDQRGAPFVENQPAAPFAFRDLERIMYLHVIQTNFQTLEALVASVALVALDFSQDRAPSATVRGNKPSALVCAEAPEVEITRALLNGQLVRLTPGAPQTPCTESVAGSTSSAPTDPPGSSPAGTSSEEETDVKTAALALGSNLGDRFTNIEVALRVLETPGVHYNGLSADAFVNVVNTSFMYETEPMYVSDQPKFINCACMIETNLSPLQLLTLVKRVEVIVGRVVSFRNGPRAIDLDVLLYSTRTVDTRPTNSRSLSAEHLEGHLVVPHPRMLEREFVLRPLNDMIPGYIHPVAKCSIRSLFSDLINIQPADTPLMNKVTPFPRYPFCGPDTPSEPESSQLPRISPVPPTATYWKYPVVSSTSLPTKALPKRKTYIMGTLNVTPDSFSDGAVNNTIPAALRYAQLAAEAGADILDVGGYSTRPGAEHVTPEEEFTRVVPVIQAIRTQFQQGALGDPSRELLISVDTFRWEVAEEAVHAGANCINDVYAFRGPGWPVDASSDENFAKMKQVARELVVPVVLMHSRGVPSANKDYSEYAYVEDSSTVEGVRVELGARVESIVKGKGGLRRWLVIIDPGVGFSKHVEGNLELLRHANTFTDPEFRVGNPPHLSALAGYPMLVGASRKSFLGLLLENPDEEGSYAGRQTKADGRDFATAGAVAWAVQSKAEIVRVHNVEGLGDVVRITSAIMG